MEIGETQEKMVEITLMAQNNELQVLFQFEVSSPLFVFHFLSISASNPIPAKPIYFRTSHTQKSEVRGWVLEIIRSIISQPGKWDSFIIRAWWCLPVGCSKFGLKFFAFSVESKVGLFLESLVTAYNLRLFLAHLFLFYFIYFLIFILFLFYLFYYFFIFSIMDSFSH